MGLELQYIDYIADCVTTQIGDFQDKNMLELGNQVIGKSAGRIKESTGKDYFTSFKIGDNFLSIFRQSKRAAKRGLANLCEKFGAGVFCNFSLNI